MNAKFCPFCGCDNIAGGEFCANCGKTLTGLVKGTNGTDNQEQTVKLMSESNSEPDSWEQTVKLMSENKYESNTEEQTLKETVMISTDNMVNAAANKPKKKVLPFIIAFVAIAVCAVVAFIALKFVGNGGKDYPIEWSYGAYEIDGNLDDYYKEEYVEVGDTVYFAIPKYMYLGPNDFRGYDQAYYSSFIGHEGRDKHAFLAEGEEIRTGKEFFTFMMNGVMAKESSEKIYDKYDLDTCGVATMSFLETEAYSGNARVTTGKILSAIGFYRIQNGKLTFLYPYVDENLEFKDMEKVEFKLKWTDTYHFDIASGSCTVPMKQSATSEYKDGTYDVYGYLSGEPYQDIVMIMASSKSIIVKLEDGTVIDGRKDGLGNMVLRYENGHITLDKGVDIDWSMSENHMSISWPGREVEFDYKDSSYWDGFVIMDGDNFYPYQYDMIAYEGEQLSDSIGDQDISNASEEDIEEIKTTQIDVATDMGNILHEKGLSSDMYDIDEKTGKIIFHDGILFDVNSYEIKADAKPVFEIFTQAYNEIYEVYGDKILYISVEGYTDSDGSDEINKPLSENRAKSVADALDTDCEVRAKGYGSSNLVLDEDGKENKSASRRVEMKIILRIQ